MSIIGCTHVANLTAKIQLLGVHSEQNHARQLTITPEFAQALLAPG